MKLIIEEFNIWQCLFTYKYAVTINKPTHYNRLLSFALSRNEYTLSLLIMDLYLVSTNVSQLSTQITRIFS